MPSSTTATNEPLVSRIELPSHVLVAGSQQTAYLIIENNTGRALRLRTTGRVPCKPKWAIAVSNASVPADVSFFDDCETAPLVIKPGENRLASQLRLTYDQCGGHTANGPAKPACLPPPNVMPPLPVGAYEAQLYGDLTSLIPTPAPVSVRVVRTGPQG